MPLCPHPALDPSFFQSLVPLQPTQFSQPIPVQSADPKKVTFTSTSKSISPNSKDYVLLNPFVLKGVYLLKSRLLVHDNNGDTEHLRFRTIGNDKGHDQ
ncbi:hypothetical protein NPIL_96071 [Nephila pilipes]|uniref:Uncharacterized protein n=1 Tax=Nephila pilipes TaxID=299642 RepID=A0A8X6UQH1_NEPPI|nr:hypothetical protein NPIL_96071 [Nephila pilipes]